MRTNRVVVLLSDDELLAIETRAGDVPLSTWIRKRVFDDEKSSVSQPVTAPVVTGKDDAVSANAPSARTSRKQSLAFTEDKMKIPNPRVFIGDVEVEFCEHGASAYHCKKWGCKFYDIPNGRK